MRGNFGIVKGKPTVFLVYHRRCSIKAVNVYKFRNIHRKTPVLDSLFNKITGLQTPIFKNICEQLLLTATYVHGQFRDLEFLRQIK